MSMLLAFLVSMVSTNTAVVAGTAVVTTLVTTVVKDVVTKYWFKQKITSDCYNPTDKQKVINDKLITDVINLYKLLEEGNKKV